jgi:prepilin-type N-terminal cleavage/methylation domain-containing protein
MERGARMERRGRARRETRRWVGRARPSGVRGSPSPESGLTLIELVIAISIFAVMAGGIASTASSGLNLIRNDRNRSVAANLASQEMDEIRQTDFTSLPLSGLTTATKTVDGVPYQVERSFDFVSTTATTSACDSLSSAPEILRATVRVRWNAMGSIPPVQSNTVITPPVGSFDPAKGNVAVKLLDRDPGVLPENIAGVLVYLVGPGVNQSVYTTAEGCGFFAQIPPGAYTVQLGNFGWVDRQGVDHPTQTAGVTAGATTAVAFDYDQAATINATLTAPGGGTLPAATWSQIPIVLGNTAFLPSGTKAFTGTGTVRTLGSLFPSSTGYTAVAGACADADNGVNEVSVTPNGTTAATVPLATVRIVYTEAGNDGPDTVRATHASDAACPVTTLDVGTANTSSEILLVALPYGTWTISIPGHSVAGGDPIVTLDPSGPSVVDVVVNVT